MYNTQGQVIGAAVSVLPATVAYAFIPSLHSADIAVGVAAFVGIWALAYVSISSIVRIVK